jgi:hypothetical protein
MKNNLKVLAIIICLSAFTACFAMMPNTLTEFLTATLVCFLFWGCMLAPAFE